jgi:predicted ABC-type transport system involved in lysophospholipase L1 biosynthesis ATPase subunit
VSSAPVLQLQLVSKGLLGGSYIEVLRGVSLEVASVEVVAVRGRRLGGKSTLLQIVAGLEEPDEGAVTLAGHPVQEQSSRSFREWWATRGTGSSGPVSTTS